MNTLSRAWRSTEGRTLPDYYARLGWIELERVEYLGKERAVMRYDIEPRQDDVTLVPPLTSPPAHDCGTTRDA